MPSGQIRTPQDKPGPSRTNQDPTERIRTPLDQPERCWAKQGPAGRIRAPGRIGSRGTSQAPTEKNQRTGTDQGPTGRTRTSLDESGPRETNQGPAVRIRVIWDGSGPRRTSEYPGAVRAPRNVSMSYGTSQGSAGRIRGPAGQTRAQQDELGTCGTDYAPRDQPGPRRTIRTPGRIVPRGMSQGPAEQIRACWTLSGPWWTNQRTVNESGSQRTNQDPEGPSRALQDGAGPRGTNSAQCFSIPSHSSKQAPTRSVRHFPTNQRRGFCRAALTPPTAETCS